MTNIYDINFSDIYVISENEVYIPSPNSETALVKLEADDIHDFYEKLQAGYVDNNPSYSINYKDTLYRVEKTFGIYGEQYCARKMPKQVPSFSALNFDPKMSRVLMSLSNKTGLILIAGPTGGGKTTTCSALLKDFLNAEGGFAYTIEDPAEMPLDGIYHATKGGLGVCKQTEPKNENWGNSLKSALRSKPRFIFVGEIRTPETASEVLRAATSGHLVLSTVHANNVQDAINSVVKYASATELSEDLAYDLFSRGVQCVMHQSLIGMGRKRPECSFLFANPDTTQGCAVRGNIKSGKLNLGTAIETQAARLQRGIPLFQDLG